MRHLNLKFILPNGSDINTENITVSECIAHLKEMFRDHYGLDMSFSRHHIYNIVERPHKTSTIYRQKVFITMVSKPQSQ